MERINKDPFDNLREFFAFDTYCCENCIKSSQPIEGGERYTNATEDNMPLCPIQRDIIMRMACDVPISQNTFDICRNFVLHGKLCPSINN